MSFELFWLIGGLFFGFIIGVYVRKKTYGHGAFIINDTLPEEEYITTHFYNRDDLYQKKHILMKIIKISDTSK